MSNESSIFGVSIRGWIAFITVFLGFVFAFAVTFFVKDAEGNVILELVLPVWGAVATWVALVYGFYFGQKSTEQQPAPPEPEQPEE